MSKSGSKGRTYDGANLSGADFANTSLNESSFRNAILVGAVFDGANLSSSDFTGADLFGASLRNVSAYGTKFIGARLAGANLTGARLSYSDLIDANCAQADFSDAEFEGTYCNGSCFDEANLSRAFISDAQCQNATFRRARLDEALVSNTDFTGADFTGASLFQAHMSGLTLDRAVFVNVRLPNGEVHVTQISDTDFGSEVKRAAPGLLKLVEAALAMLRYEQGQNPDDRAEAIRIHTEVRQSAAFKDGALVRNRTPVSPEDLAGVDELIETAWLLILHFKLAKQSTELTVLQSQFEAAAEFSANPREKCLLGAAGAACRRALRPEGSDAADTDTEAIERALAFIPQDSRLFVILAEDVASALEQFHAVEPGDHRLDRAIKLRRKALPREIVRANPAMLLGLGRSLAQRHSEQGSDADLQEAVHVLDEGVRAALAQDADAVAAARNALGIALRERYMRTGEIRDLDAAMAELNEAVEVARLRRQGTAKFQSDLASGLRHRYQAAGDAADLEAAVATLETAIEELAPEERALRRDLLQNLGNVLVARYRNAGDLADLTRAIQANEHAAQRAETIQQKTSSLSNLGETLRLKYGRTGSLDDLSRAIEASAGAVRLSPPRLTHRPRYLSNLAGCLVMRHALTRITSDLDEAFRLLREAGEVMPAKAPERSLNRLNLAACLLRQFESGGNQDSLDECVDVLEQLGCDESAACPKQLFLEARARRQRGDLNDSAADRDAAVAAFRSACHAGTRAEPTMTLIAAEEWGMWAGHRERWAEAAEAFQFGLGSAQALYRGQTSLDRKQERLEDAKAMPVHAAYALSKSGDYEEAVLSLEQALAIELSETLQDDSVALDELRRQGYGDLAGRYETLAMKVRDIEASGERDAFAMPGEHEYSTVRAARDELRKTIDSIRGVPGLEHFHSTPTIATVGEASSEAPVVYICASEWGGLALIVRAGATFPVWLPDVTTEELKARVKTAVAEAQSRHQGPGFVKTIDKLTRWLSVAVMEPLMRRLRPRKKAIIIPVGLLGALPLHAAWEPAAGTADSRRYVLEDIEITYVPNARFAANARGLTKQRRLESALIVEEPRPVSAGSLRFAEDEALAVAEAFRPAVERLRHDAATRINVLQRMPDYSLLHFVCHGQYSAGSALESGLVMAGDEVLSLRDIVRLRLQARLAVLSACESAVREERLTDEVVGLTGSFLRAGVAGVIGSLWRVQDESTANLMVRFYQLLQQGQVPPPVAFRQAQLEMAHLYPPYYWAGFLYTGA